MRVESKDDERNHEIQCHVMSKDWCVSFHEFANPKAAFPWLLCATHDEVLRILEWGHISGQHLDEHHRNIARWGVGGGTLRLTERQYRQLIARRQGWPWNGYELQQMKDNGTYPPNRLTPTQEEQFLRNRKSR